MEYQCPLYVGDCGTEVVTHTGCTVPQHLCQRTHRTEGDDMTQLEWELLP